MGDRTSKNGNIFSQPEKKERRKCEIIDKTLLGELVGYIRWNHTDDQHSQCGRPGWLLYSMFGF